MRKHLPYYRVKCCGNCPFKKDTMKGWLGRSRAKEIVEAESFVCHKNTDIQCVGHIMVAKGRNIFRRLLEMEPELIKDLKDKNEKLVFNNPQKFIEHHGQR